jgi:hypothetical protein
MAKKRSGPFSLKEERQLIQMAATSATLEKAAAIFRTSVDTIERKAKRLGIKLKGKRPKLGRNEELLGGSAMQYAHWLMVAGAVLVVLGFIGFALHKNDAGTDEGHLTRDTSWETVEAALESEMEGEGEMPPKRQRRPNGIFGGS